MRGILFVLIWPYSVRLYAKDLVLILRDRSELHIEGVLQLQVCDLHVVCELHSSCTLNWVPDKLRFLLDHIFTNCLLEAFLVHQDYQELALKPVSDFFFRCTVILLN